MKIRKHMLPTADMIDLRLKEVSDCFATTCSLACANARFPVDDFQEGIPQLAALLNSNDSFALFRRFGQLSSRVLIHMTIELADLEKELADMDSNNASNSDKAKQYRLYGAGDANGWGKEHEALVMKIKGKLQEYCRSLSHTK